MAVSVVGWIGLGNAGRALAACLATAGYSLLIRDADHEREVSFAESTTAATVAPEGQDVFRNVDIIVTMLPHGKVVREVLVGPDGIAPSLRKGGAGPV
jgi:3-hydroxyisobutyrate dehydrogenase-like beta-hydroxyacid dehydrogenase